MGPKSKYDPSIPYTYMARTPVINGEDDLYSYYFADTICALVAYLSEHRVPAEETELFGVYRKQEILLDKSLVTGKSGKWLERPHICHSLEKHYEKTRDELYKGHHEKDTCSFDDRKLKGSGPI
jgi:hypothetical protein